MTAANSRRSNGVVLVAVASMALSFLLSTPSVMAEPAFAVRTGYRCSQCHVNRTGGGLRTAFGSIYTQTVLPRRLLRWRGEENLLPANPDARFAFGGDFRVQYLNVESPDGADSSSFEIPEANAYALARLAPKRFDLYLDATLGPGGASAREVFGQFYFAPKKRGYVKAGKFLPAYGWRLPDNDAFIRRFTGFNYAGPDNGVEVGIEPGRWSLHLSVTNGAGGGSDDNTSKRLALLSVRRFERWRVGVSGSNNIAGGTTTTHAGLLAGGNLGRIALLAEGDWVESTRNDGTDHSLIGFLEADVLVTRGFNLKLAHDWYDPDTSQSTDSRTRDSIGFELIPIPFLQLRWFVRYADGPPQVPGARYTQVDIEAHIFF